MSELFSLKNYSVRGLSNLISSLKISPVDVIESTIQRINQFNSELNSFITILDDAARNDAARAEREIKMGNYKGPLHGIPVSLKDLIFVKNVLSTSGSKILSEFVPKEDAVIVTKLKEAGAIIIGTNNTHEFACGLTNINPHFGSSKNPWHTEHMSGGSSGGSAVAVCAGLSPVSIGTDTSGSIRVPSSFCGIFGLKPTYGRVSNVGMMPLAPSLDHVGPIARTAWDIAAVLQVIAGRDGMDKNSISIPVPDYLAEIEHGLTTDFKIGIPNQYFLDVIDPKVLDIFETFVKRINAIGISTTNVDVDDTDKIHDTWKALRLGESAATHKNWLETVPEKYGSEVREMLTKGMKITAVEYIIALKIKDKIKESFLKAMNGLDALLVPTTIIPPPLLDQKAVKIGNKELRVYDALSRNTIGFSVAGLPVLNVPAGLVDGKLPVGCSLVGRPFDEGTLLKIGHKMDEKLQISQNFIPPVFEQE